MKCPNCDGTGEVIDTSSKDPTYLNMMPRNHCHRGWLPFWTEAERAGLRGMGRHIIAYRLVKGNFNKVATALTMIAATGGVIRAYVKASREVKERK
jgi:hypothetical protein